MNRRLFANRAMSWTTVLVILILGAAVTHVAAFFAGAWYAKPVRVTVTIPAPVKPIEAAKPADLQVNCRDALRICREAYRNRKESPQ